MSVSNMSTIVQAASRVVAALVLGLTAMLFTSRGQPQHHYGPSWTVMRPPSPSGSQARFTGVSALNARDVWAVGTTAMSDFIEHWNGSSWRIVPSPKLSAALEAVKAVATNDVWFIGRANDEPLIEHWNGRSVSVVPGPEDSGGLFALSSLDSADILAVGGIDEDSPGIVMRWNGRAWSKFKLSGQETFLGVALVSKNKAWAVGETFGGSGGTAADIERWNGKGWKDLGGVGLAEGASALYAVSAIKARNVWAVGASTSGNPAIVHWNGMLWKVERGVPISGNLAGVATVNWHDVVAVGGSSFGHTLVEHWNGRQWQLWRTPKVGRAAYFSSISVASDGSVWVVGAHGSNDVRPLVERAHLRT